MIAIPENERFRQEKAIDEGLARLIEQSLQRDDAEAPVEVAVMKRAFTLALLVLAKYFDQQADQGNECGCLASHGSRQVAHYRRVS